jgi:hypothetical protein
VVLIHRFYVLGVDLHFHKFSSPNSLYFGRNRRFYLPICAQIAEFLAQFLEPAKAVLHTGNSRTESKNPDSKKCEPAKAGPSIWSMPPASLDPPPRPRLAPSCVQLHPRPPPLLQAHASASAPPRQLPCRPAFACSVAHALAPAPACSRASSFRPVQLPRRPAPSSLPPPAQLLAPNHQLACCLPPHLPQLAPQRAHTPPGQPPTRPHASPSAQRPAPTAPPLLAPVLRLPQLRLAQAAHAPTQLLSPSPAHTHRLPLLARTSSPQAALAPSPPQLAGSAPTPPAHPAKRQATFFQAQRQHSTKSGNSRPCPRLKPVYLLLTLF